MDNTTLFLLGLLVLLMLLARRSQATTTTRNGGEGQTFIAYRKDGGTERRDLGEPFDDCRYYAQEAAEDWLSEGKYSRIEYTDPSGKKTVFIEKHQ